jgi:LmbE family N-acetylglucosaminyl deacetylase
MTAPNPYLDYVSAIARLAREGRGLPLGGVAPLPRPDLPPGAPRVLVFSPHPDDECIVGGLALRLMRESRVRILDVAVTLGSDRARQAARLDELRAACGYLGFEVVTTAPRGLEDVNPRARALHAREWQAAVDVVARIVADHRPAVVFCPHEGDWNSTHVGTHLLVMDALARQAPDFACAVVETEYWGAMATPNLMVELGAEDLAHLLTALSFHAGEVRRNPYHLLLPAWMQDNVRRGSELVGGQGGAAPDFTFATLYRLSRWADGALQPSHAAGRTLAASVDPWAVVAAG